MIFDFSFFKSNLSSDETAIGFDSIKEENL